MKKETKNRKLGLNKETLRQLASVSGGGTGILHLQPTTICSGGFGCLSIAYCP